MGARRKSRMGRQIVAVDFDSRQLRIVEATRAGRAIRIGRAAAVVVPDDVNVADAASFGGFLSRILRQMKLHKASVLMTVGRAEAVFKPLTLPPGTADDEMAGMVQFQMQAELPYRPEEAVIDYTVEAHYDAATGAAPADHGVDVLVAAVKLPVVDHFRQVAHAAGVNLVRLGLRPYANRRCVEACVERRPEETLAVIHLTADQAEIDVLAGASLTFSRSAVVNVPPAGSTDPAEAARCVESITLEAARSLRSYTAIEGGRRIDRLVVAGSTGLEELLVDALASRLHVPCQRLAPAEPLGLPDAQAADASGFITALGLAISSGGETPPFDFLNPKRPVVKRDTRRQKVLAGAAGLILLLAAGWILPQKLILEPRRQKLLALRTQLTKEKDIKAARLADEANLRQWQEWIRERGDLLAHPNYIAAIMPPADQVLVPELRSGDATGAEYRTALTFRAKATTEDVLMAFRQQLEKAGYEVKVDNKTRDRDERYGVYADMRVTFPPSMQVDLSAVRPAPRPADDISTEKGYQR